MVRNPAQTAARSGSSFGPRIERWAVAGNLAVHIGHATYGRK
jgi:hypothetical protein